MNEIRAISLFVRTATLGSLRKAAIEQGVTPQAASLAVAQLEKHLGIRLFHRTTRQISLTDEGRRFLESVQPPLQALTDVMHSARHADRASGPLRVTAPRALGNTVLWPLFETFAREHPDVHLDIQLEDRFQDWVAERIDVGFRAGQQPDGRIVARRVLPIQLIVCAAPDYLARHGAPATIDDLATHRCTGYLQPNTGKVAPWEFQVGEEIVYRDVPPALCMNDPELETRAVAAGLGIGQLGSFTAVPLIRAGQLVPLLLPHTVQRIAMYLCYARRTHMPLRVRLFIDFMMERLQASTEWHLNEEELRAGKPARKRRQGR
ncbi:LysR family transcriptional regulator [Bordetella bronchialis]|uniref:LysR family transcriptional regulator n=1 Tax=Bordetella bronchialis TaxID=463025 RepID=A0A193FTH0_9BORD|nr:LysR family transcriptional regulator [Bordetella bronchialis]ANN65850.1 LysR family transcriptional regulator [Bordetella bronchialis]ANN70935.1 LysR family transcriptional regulator [Bordetella bronchialis]